MVYHGLPINSMVDLSMAGPVNVITRWFFSTNRPISARSLTTGASSRWKSEAGSPRASGHQLHGWNCPLVRGFLGRNLHWVWVFPIAIFDYQRTYCILMWYLLSLHLTCIYIPSYIPLWHLSMKQRLCIFLVYCKILWSSPLIWWSPT